MGLKIFQHRTGRSYTHLPVFVTVFHDLPQHRHRRIKCLLELGALARGDGFGRLDGDLYRLLPKKGGVQ